MASCKACIEIGFFRPVKEAESAFPPWAISTFSETSDPAPHNLIITLPRLLYKVWMLKVVPQQWLYELKSKFILKTLSCITMVFLLGFYLHIESFAFV